ncbi:MAG: hypothetical protein AB7J13_14845 [Pyrinomonadaceae bacterium]
MEFAALRQLHDELLATQPSGATHESADCPFCAGVGTDENHPGGEMSTFTQEDLDAAVADALAPLQQKLKELQESHQESEVEGRIAAAKAELETRITDLQGELDSSVLKVSEAERRYDELVAFLDSERVAQEAAAELAARKDERLVLVKEVASFPDEYVAANADRWAGLADEEFEALVNDWKAISVARKDAGDITELPRQTSMQANRSDGGSKSVMSEVLEWTLQGHDPRTL